MAEIDFIDKVVSIQKALTEKNKFFGSIYRIFTIFTIGMPLLVYLILHYFFCKIMISKEEYNTSKIVFAWYPVRTSYEWIWLRNVKRSVYTNPDMISYYQYRYEKV